VHVLPSPQINRWNGTNHRRIWVGKRTVRVKPRLEEDFLEVPPYDKS
jgi:hypothetical protein